MVAAAPAGAGGGWVRWATPGRSPGSVREPDPEYRCGPGPAADPDSALSAFTRAFTRAYTPSPVQAGRHAHRSVGLRGLVSGWTGDRLPLLLQGTGRMSGAHLAVLGLVLVLGGAATLWWLGQARGGDEAVLPPAVVPSSLVGLPSSASSVVPTAPGPPGGPGGSVGPGGSAGPAGSGTTAAAGGVGPVPGGQGAAGTTTGAPAAAQVVVDVAGKVRRPGIATLPAGARVVDALEAAGGARPGVRLGSLNLARVLADGEQIVVGVPPVAGVAAQAASAAPAAPSGSAGSAGSAVPMVDINTAGQAELEELPGVGPVTAQSILAFRTEHGTFTAVDELLEVSGIGDATLAKIAPFVTL